LSRHAALRLFRQYVAAFDYYAISHIFIDYAIIAAFAVISIASVCFHFRLSLAEFLSMITPRHFLSIAFFLRFRH